MGESRGWPQADGFVCSAVWGASHTPARRRLRQRAAHHAVAHHHASVPAAHSAAAPAAHDHEARASKMMAELDSGDSSMLDALERSVDERLAATKRELLKVTDFRKRAMTLLQTKLGTTRLFSLFVMRFPSAFCLFSHAMRSQRSWRLAMIRRLQLRSVPPSNRGMLTLHSLSLSLLPSLRLCGSRTSTHTRVVSHRLSGTSSSAKSDAAAHPDSTAEADAAAGGVEDPIGALLALDSDEQQTREALEQAQQQMQSMRLQQTGASESGGEGLEAGEEEAMDLSLDQQVSALKQNLTRIHEQRTELFRYLQPRRLHPLPL